MKDGIIREQIEKQEVKTLSPYACCALHSRGRKIEETPCDIRTCFQRDRDRIMYSKAFRRLKDKTQVFLSPQGDHYRTRLMHTLEVSQIARTIGKALSLNVDLVEAIALGHDLGHTPFGHAGERALNEVCPLGFEHSEQSLRVVDVLERNGDGLNLSEEVRDGILQHQTTGHPATLEGQVVRFSDKIAYIHHDMDDGIRAGIVHEEDIPSDLRNVLGETTKDRLDTMIHDIILTSYEKPEIAMSQSVWEALLSLRGFMFEHLYTNNEAKVEEGKAATMLQQLYVDYMQDPSRLSPEYLALHSQRGERIERVICDYISGMTDQFSIFSFKKIHEPKIWEKY